VGATIGAAFGGPAGVTRLLTGTLAAQGSWLLPLALVGFVSALAAAGWRRRSVRLAGLIVFGGWTGVVWAVFSFANGVFHPYYISEFAPGVAALVGIGVVALWRDVLSRGWRALQPAVAIAGTGVFEWSILRSEHALDGWGTALAAIGVALALVLLAWPLAARRSGRLRRRDIAIATAGVGLGLAVLLVAPAAYAEGVITTVANGQIPIAQPQAPARKRLHRLWVTTPARSSPSPSATQALTSTCSPRRALSPGT
jgi:4-amino-4-deoxy-L-arabinose transferase-like glycosyltransferase